MPRGPHGACVSCCPCPERGGGACPRAEQGGGPAAPLEGRAVESIGSGETRTVRPSDTCHSGRRWPREGPAGIETWIQSDSQSRVRLDVDFLAELGAGPSPRVFNPLPSGGAGICRWTAVLPAAQVPRGASGSGRPQAPWEPLGCAPVRTAHLTVAAAPGWRVLAHVAPTPSPALPREREPPPSGLSEGWGFGDVGVAAQTAEHTLSLLF